MPQFKFHTLDVFTTQKFVGNPLAVVMDADSLSTEEMQTIAREFNLSETIFVRKPVDAAHTASVRIFFPTAEIPFAGHPTVGCAILLAEMKHGTDGDFADLITLEEVAGLVPVQVERQSGMIRAQFTAPVIPSEIEQAQVNAETLANGFNLQPGDIGFGNHVAGNFEGGPNFYYVPVGSKEALANAKPGGAGWETLKQAANNEAFFLYTPYEDGFRSRMFAPDHGIAEDPATGSASAIFAAQWLKAEGLVDGTHKTNLYQGYDMGRPSEIGLELDIADGKIEAVRISGSAIRVMSGELSI